MKTKERLRLFVDDYETHKNAMYISFRYGERAGRNELSELRGSKLLSDIEILKHEFSHDKKQLAELLDYEEMLRNRHRTSGRALRKGHTLKIKRMK